eukprot:TRINITY_DN2098_c0_g1_i1.p1 TRINITY_DN2098_c0_g1~~TRINITY_DN2098_c0_g1_i1.p1  ORF type:complete len:129 (-),score=22.99 TRINITY_DN2098_c0_g1_i1:27-368(-)
MDPESEEAMEREIEAIRRGKFEIEFDFVTSPDLLNELWDMGLRNYCDIEDSNVSEELRTKLQEMMSMNYFGIPYAEHMQNQEEMLADLPPLSPEMVKLQELGRKIIEEQNWDG